MTKSSEPNDVPKPLAAMGRGAFAVTKFSVFVSLTLFLGLVLVNFVLQTAVGFLQLAILFVLILPSVPALYAMDAQHRSRGARIALGLVSVILWAVVLFSIYRFG